MPYNRRTDAKTALKYLQGYMKNTELISDCATIKALEF